MLAGGMPRLQVTLGDGTAQCGSRDPAQDCGLASGEDLFFGQGHDGSASLQHFKWCKRCASALEIELYTTFGAVVQFGFRIVVPEALRTGPILAA